MQNYSTTQAANLSAIIGVVMLLLNYWKIQIAQEELQALIGGLLAVGGILLSFYKRWARGDLKLSGVRLPKLDL